MVNAAVFFALKIEAQGIIDRLRGVVSERGHGFVVYEGGWQGKRIQVVVAGPGRANVSRAVEAVQGAYQPRWILSAGFAGGLQHSLQRADLLIPDRLVDGVTGSHLQVEHHWQPNRGEHVGTLVTVDEVIASVAGKQELARAHSALGVDMESYAVARFCHHKKVRFLCIRAISDVHDQELPPGIAHLMRQRSLPGKVGAVTGFVVRDFAGWKVLWQLRKDANACSERLAECLAGVLTQLPVD